jgi:hypothetical protein
LSGCAEPVTPTCTPTGTPLSAFLFGGYDPRNTLPYSENWTLDVQWQPYNSLLIDVGYVGNHGQHELLPIPFNQPGIATPTHPINGQIYVKWNSSERGLLGQRFRPLKHVVRLSDHSRNAGLRRRRRRA